MGESERPCELVIKHEGILGGMAADIQHIKSKVDNGLSAKLDETKEALAKFIATTEADRRVDAAENWFSRILQGSVKKVIGYAVLAIIVSALASGGVWSALRAYAWKESPGQLNKILAQGTDTKAAIAVVQQHSYHEHILTDGRILFHTGNANERAYILDPVSGKYERAPQMRTENSVIGK